MISFTVPGEPVPQPRQRFSVVAGFPKPYKDEKHPVHAYRQAVALAAKLAGLGQITEPIQVCVVSVFERPKSHTTGRGVVKATAPRVPRPDVDNLAKAVLDALGDFFNDKLVESLQVSKSYGDVAYTKVTIA
jgi:Holliday junction resolvase RusA-like endonuclease